MKKKKKKKLQGSVAEKTNRLLLGILVVLLTISAKLWHVAVIEHEEKKQEAYKPQHRKVPLIPDRATICDREGVVMAKNIIQYNVSVSYGAIRSLPMRVSRTDHQGSKQVISFRKQYIKRLAQMLAEELYLDATYIEDIIHAKASVLGDIPCIIKIDIPEKVFLKLKMLEKDWPGLVVESVSRRYYPLGKLASDIVGYVGPISLEEYNRVTKELGRLRECIRAYEEGEDPALPLGMASIDEVKQALACFEKKAYRVNALVGKTGVEAFFDQDLRGSFGTRTFVIDRQGNIIDELKNREEAKVSGDKLHLTLSTELQRFADGLLAEHERISGFRSAKSIKKKSLLPPLFPWIKGGSIVVLDPNNGQVLAMSSSPRYDPNDFIKACYEYNRDQNFGVHRWLESERYIAGIFDFKCNLLREKLRSNNSYYEEELELNFENYLNLTLSLDSDLRNAFLRFSTVGHAIDIQDKMRALMQLFYSEDIKVSPRMVMDIIYPKYEGHTPFGEVTSLEEREFLLNCYQHHKLEIEDLKISLDEYYGKLSLNYDKLLLVDIFSIFVDPLLFTSDCRNVLNDISINDFSKLRGHSVALRNILENILEDVFIENDFKSWRQESFSTFLSLKRQEERVRKQKYPKPYTDYLEKERKRQYKIFCENHLNALMSSLLTGCAIEDDPSLNPYFSVIDSWRQELENGAHKALIWRKHYNYLKDQFINIEMNPEEFFNVCHSYEDLTGKVFGNYPQSLIRNNPQIKKDLVASFYPSYGFGYLRAHAYRQAAVLGSIFKLVTTYAYLAQQTMRADVGEDDLINALVLIDKQSFDCYSSKPHVGFFENRDPIGVFYKGGCLPGNDYVARGQINLLKALEMSSNPYFSLLAADFLSDAEDLCDAASLFGFGEKTGISLVGEYKGSLPEDIVYNRSGLYAAAIGQHTLVVTPLQTACMMASFVNGGILYKPNILLGKVRNGQFIPQEPVKRREIYMPDVITNIMKEGMKRTIHGNFGTARSVKDAFPKNLLSRVIGKTSTAETVVRTGLEYHCRGMTMKSIWFGAISFLDDNLEEPDLVVIVYLRLGEFGRDAAPMALKMIQKWEEIRKASL